ncbi:MAG: orotidine-5'-phosphate decarboxylase, partial [Nanoarchaeota archaeon]|nr:orotidine-5'-phosphate decarboxylase [Nanoarchaeota archaeon]
MNQTNFADRLIKEIEKKQNPTVVGLDPRLEQIPSFIKTDMTRKYGKNFEAAGACFFEFNKIMIDSVHDIVPAVKPQSAFYEQYGQFGMRAFDATVKYAKKKGLLVIDDAKRGDIGTTSEAYARAILGDVNLFDSQVMGNDCDCVTVNPYLGSDGVMPFVEQCKKHGKGIFVLVKTSNKSSGELQDLFVQSVKADSKNKERVYEVMAKLVDKWGKGTEGKFGYKSVGAV